VVDNRVAIEFNGIEISPWVEQKINGKHHVSADEIAEACERGPEYIWGTNPLGIEQLLCRGVTDSGRAIEFALYPIDAAAGEWRLATAYPRNTG